ncbi:MAG: hypothetical protein NTV49_12280 [Kiritimatiellaeota bacterium]|nr:hypothetical protein [Kiritimatiellota bacterium]
MSNATGYIGHSGSGNAGTVTGSGSVWNNTGDPYVGYYTDGNTLTITNGGTVYSATGHIGAYGFGNAATVPGTNSVWNNSGDLHLGFSGSGNTLTIADGGAVSNAIGWIGSQTFANNNAVTVTGTNSVWNNTGDIYLGYYGSGNTLTITNGAVVNNGVSSSGAGIGWTTDAHNNAVTVTGTNSVWNNSGSVFVGVSGYSNSLTIADGGAVNNTVYGSVIGNNSSASNNTVLVTDPGSAARCIAPPAGSASTATTTLLPSPTRTPSGATPATSSSV